VCELCRDSVNSDRDPTLESLWCNGILACRDTHDITLEWMIYKMIVSYPITYLMLFVHLHIIGRIRYCLVIYGPMSRDHLCSGTQCGDCADPSEAISL
jgi:hypothetical protein